MYSLLCLFLFQISVVLSRNSDNSSSQFNLYENKLAAFPKPDFNTSFVLRSQKGFKSFKQIRHGLGVEPFYVRVYAKPKSGPNKGYAFNGVGTNQVDARFSSYGGLIYAYNSEYIRIWAPTNKSGYIIFIKDGWGSERYAQKTGKAVVVVEMWKSGPDPNFQIDTVIGNGTHRGSYGEVDHQLEQIPDRVLVRVSPENPVSNNGNPNAGYWFHATGSSQNSFRNSTYGGVIFAYNEIIIRLWAPDEKLNQTGCILIDKGWGDGKYSQRVTRCRVQVKVWVNMLPLPSFQTDWFSFQAQRGVHSFKTIKHGLNVVPELVLVQTRPLKRMNAHFIFEAQGSVQSDDDSGAYGGITFAYDENNIRLWAPTKNDGTKKGYGVLVKEGWGDNRFLQNEEDIDVEIRIQLFTSKCKQATAACFVNNTCVTTQFDSYTWEMSSWTNCSSICNNGTQKRHSTGCLVKSKSIISSGSCDFEKDFCGWSQTSLTSFFMNWKRTNTITLTANTGPLWGHRKGSYYVYTYSKNVVPNRPGTLTSPYIPGARKCHLTFFWNMYGKDIGELSVEVRTGDLDGWRKTGWSMEGSQGPIYWRSAYINLEHFAKIYRIRFTHSLPSRPDYCKDICTRCNECSVCEGGRCLYVNVAIDDIELWCEASYNITDTPHCMARNAKYAGCDVASTVTDALKHLKGPAYGEEQVYYDRTKEFRTFVDTVGSKYDLVALYSIKVAFKAYYSLWMSVYSTNETNNKIAFRIDEGDWHVMHTAYKKTHHLWLTYRAKSFLLWPAVHTITFRQVSHNFRFDQIALSPTKLSNWVDLGMQSRHIPDSHITARPPRNSRPAPKHGRLNAAEAWCSSDHNPGYIYLQVELPGLAILSRIAVQGAKNIDQKSNNYWTKSYKVKVSIDEGSLNHFTWYRNRTDVMMFVANADSSSIVEFELPYAVPVRAVRLFPYTWENWPCLRVELYGVYLSSAVCATSGPELPTVKSCVGNRDCGTNAECQNANKNKGIRKTIHDLWHKVFPTSDRQNSSTTEHCTCYHGYHGASCQHYGCTPNPCDNNGTCSQNTLNGTFSCKCPPGFYGNTCQKSCQQGYYGYNCSQKCLCSSHSSCNEATGHCNCYKGFKGEYCDDKCDGGYYGYNCAQKCQCRNGATCDHIAGACNCTVGWTGIFCDQQCPWNTWGKFCRYNCSCSSSALECNRKTGECICDNGYFGRYCKKTCPSGKYGWNCTHTCRCAKNTQCSTRDGTCNCTEPGFRGVLCDQPCPHVFYGVGCRQQCLCKNGADCDRITGKCTCTSGWLGKLCNTPCRQGSWGRNCSQSCFCSHGARCNTSTGQCICDMQSGCICDGGWSGADCRVPCGTDRWGAGCSRTCTCKNNGACHPVTGQCKCLPGNSGANCEHSCIPSYYGNNCSLPCSCNTSTSSKCDPSTGACTCLPGWQGQTCDIPCSKGLWGINCNTTCRCVHGSCDPIHGNCVCIAKWKGALCDQPCAICGLPCPKCYHGNCDPSKSQCICNAGYIGAACLDACPSGFYGQGCQHRCVCVHGVCRPDSGVCGCYPGWTGSKCDQACPPGNYGYSCLQKCQCVHGSCIPLNGSCSCNKGYHGNGCSRPCPAGWYGSGCLSQCQCSNGTSSCDHVTGQCLCRSGWMGTKCDGRCQPGFYGLNCTARCLCKSCDPLTGSCHCPPGWQGLRCTQPCLSGYYGNNCSQPCQCANHSFCNHVDGTCACKAGWSGVTCRDHCRPGRYGMQCLSHCICALNVTEVSRPCHHVTGTCNCRPGYQGFRCLDQCTSNYYGKNCSEKCLICRNHGICNFIDGSCLCPPGYYGRQCEMTCPPGRYGTSCSNTCACIAGHTQECNKVDGGCICGNGYIGVFCENRCPEGTFGHGCHGNCQCNNNAHCDHVTGACVCPPGYKGKYCDVKCSGFMFGPGCKNKCLCENGATCDPFTGDCYCEPGFSGTRCSTECLEGRFGVDCVNICDCNPSHTKTCDHKDGTCHCNPGYTHRRCDQTCKDGFYGEKCTEHCPQCSRHVSGPCNKQHGNCTCAPGYHGYQCYDDCPLNLFGLHCKEKCTCPTDKMCYHVDGTCLLYKQGLFHLVIEDALELFDDPDRIQDFKIGLEQLMYKYFDKIRKKLNETSLASQIKDDPKASSPSALEVAPMARGSNTTESSPIPVPPKHNFVVRIIDMVPVFLDKTVQGTRVGSVLMDGDGIINGSDVLDVLQLIPNSEIADIIAAKYYTGKLYVPPKTSTFSIHLPLIIGVSVGTFLIVIILVTFKLRYKYMKKTSRVRKEAKKDPAEIELIPFIAHGGSHLLAFENPYYDVLAAMGLDDDVGEEYCNPLYDDVSLCSDSYNGSSDYSYKDIAHMIVR